MTGKDKIDNMIKKFVNKRTINCSGGVMTMTGMECIMKVLDKDSKAKKVCHDKIIYACAKTLNKMFKQNEWSLEAKDGQVLSDEAGDWLMTGLFEGTYEFIPRKNGFKFVTHKEVT